MIRSPLWRRSSYEIYKPLVQCAVHSSENFCVVFFVPLCLFNSWFLVGFRGFDMPYMILTMWSIKVKYGTQQQIYIRKVSMQLLKQQKPNAPWCSYSHHENTSNDIIKMFNFKISYLLLPTRKAIQNSSLPHFRIKHYSKYLFFPVTWGTKLYAFNTNLISFCWQLKTLTFLVLSCCMFWNINYSLFYDNILNVLKLAAYPGRSKCRSACFLGVQIELQ